MNAAIATSGGAARRKTISFSVVDDGSSVDVDDASTGSGRSARRRGSRLTASVSRSRHFTAATMIKKFDKKDEESGN